MKIRNTRFLIFVCICVLAALPAYPQKIKDIFMSLPDNLCLKLNKDQRHELFTHFENGKLGTTSTNMHFEVYDPANGFLSISGAFEGWWEMCFWDKKDGTQLVGLFSAACGPDCEGKLSFAVYAKGVLSSIPLSDIVTEIKVKDFIDIEAMHANEKIPQSLFSHIHEEGVLYELPRKGKNITAYTQFLEYGDFKPEWAEKYWKGSRIELIWQEGKFTEGAISE